VPADSRANRVVQSSRARPTRSYGGSDRARAAARGGPLGRSHRRHAPIGERRTGSVPGVADVSRDLRRRRRRVSPAPGKILPHRRAAMARVRSLCGAIRERGRRRGAGSARTLLETRHLSRRRCSIETAPVRRGRADGGQLAGGATWPGDHGERSSRWPGRTARPCVRGPRGRRVADRRARRAR